MILVLSARNFTKRLWWAAVRLEWERENEYGTQLTRLNGFRSWWRKSLKNTSSEGSRLQSTQVKSIAKQIHLTRRYHSHNQPLDFSMTSEFEHEWQQGGNEKIREITLIQNVTWANMCSPPLPHSLSSSFYLLQFRCRRMTFLTRKFQVSRRVPDLNAGPSLLIMFAMWKNNSIVSGCHHFILDVPIPPVRVPRASEFPEQGNLAEACLSSSSMFLIKMSAWKA